MTAKINYYGEKLTVCGGTPENEKLLAQNSRNWESVGAAGKMAVVSGTIASVSLFIIIVCGIYTCFSKNIDQSQAPVCNSMCAHGVRITCICLSIIFSVGFIISCCLRNSK